MREGGQDPSTYMRVVASILLLQQVPGNLDPDEWAILRRVIDLIQANAKGAELGPVLETIENALRADQATVIEAE